MKRMAEAEISDEELFGKFYVDASFKMQQQLWSKEKRDAFCKMARAVHRVGLDWYKIKNEIRFGQKEPGTKNAVPTAGILNLGKGGHLKCHHSGAVELGLEEEYQFDEKSASQFVKKITNRNAERIIAKWLPLVRRRGFWPTDYPAEGDIVPSLSPNTRTSSRGKLSRQERYRHQLYVEGVNEESVVLTRTRNGTVREECIREFGSKCGVCRIDFGKRFGDEFIGLIHVHHKKPIASGGGEGVLIDPVKDCIPLCPNCHAMAHFRMSRNKCRSVEQLKSIVRSVQS
jgi:5-methylcytosine-specific restriction endonuclease McrA